MRVVVSRTILLVTWLLEIGTETQGYTCPDGSRFSLTEPYSLADVLNTFKNQCKCSCCQPKEHLDCSAGILGDILVGSYMEPACYIHDYCYDNPQRTKAQCDNEFYYNMEMCLYVEDNPDPFYFSNCRIVRDSAYAAVRDWGDTHPSTCSMDCPCTRSGMAFRCML